MAIGVFIGVTPTIPFHTVLILFLIFLSRQNLTAALLGAWITNPVTIPFFYLTEYEIGKFILGWDQYRGLLTEYNVHQLLKMGWEILGPLQIGGLILAPFLLFPLISSRTRPYWLSEGGERMVSASELLRKYRIRPLKRLGQSFLIDPNIITKIVRISNVHEQDIVLEIGAGLGIMTLLIAERAQRVVAVDIDPAMIAILRQELKDVTNIEIIHADILDYDVGSALFRAGDEGRLLKVIGNIPYNISTQILFRLIEARTVISEMVLMFQKEVGERLSRTALYQRLRHPLRQNGEDAVIFRTRRCEEPLTDLLLEHQDHLRNDCPCLDEPEEDLGRDIVRDIADDLQKPALVSSSKKSRTDIVIQYIRMNDFYVGHIFQFLPKDGNHGRINVDCDDPLRPFSNEECHYPEPRSNLQNDVLLMDIGNPDDLRNDIWIYQEGLAQSLQGTNLIFSEQFARTHHSFPSF